MSQSEKPREWNIDEIKKYKELADLYYKSARLTSEFDSGLFHRLCDKYEPLDLMQIMLDAYDSQAAKIAELEAEVEQWKQTMGRCPACGEEWVTLASHVSAPVLQERDQLAEKLRVAVEALVNIQICSSRDDASYRAKLALEKLKGDV